jgi:hypothetical protein
MPEHWVRAAYTHEQLDAIFQQNTGFAAQAPAYDWLGISKQMVMSRRKEVERARA